MASRPLGDEPLEQGAGVVEREPHAGMALERVDHRLVGLLEDLREDPAEVADRLVVVERERQRDPRRHGVSRPRSRPALATATWTSTPAAGRYRRSVYSWSMRVVENRQSEVAIARRIVSTQRSGTPALSRS